MIARPLREVIMCLALAPLYSSTPALASEAIAYTYDAQGRLVTTTHSGTVNNNVEVTYSFDPADNRTHLTIVNGLSRVIVVPIRGLTVIPIPDP